MKEWLDKQARQSPGGDPVHIASVEWIAAANKAGLNKNQRHQVKKAFTEREWLKDAVGGDLYCPP